MAQCCIVLGLLKTGGVGGGGNKVTHIFQTIVKHRRRKPGAMDKNLIADKTLNNVFIESTNLTISPTLPGGAFLGLWVLHKQQLRFHKRKVRG